jgi:mono/diheme cytochrome c family protein
MKSVFTPPADAAMTRLAAPAYKVRGTNDGGKADALNWGSWFLAAASAVLVLSACDTTGLPREYRTVAVPEARLTALDARSRGRSLFLEHCAICHGERADGQGRRRNLSHQPADFTDAAWRGRATPRWVYYVVREGIRNTPMPAWKILSEDETWDLVAYVLSVAASGADQRS